MAQDYNIYIYSQKSGSTSSNIKPIANQTEEEKQNSVAGSIQSFINNGQSIASMVKGGGTQIIGKVASKNPWVAVAVAVAAIVDKVLTTGAGHLETYTGRYELAVEMNNLHANISNALNPIGMLYNQYKWNKQNQVYNIKQEQERKLYGNSVLNTEIKGV